MSDRVRYLADQGNHSLPALHREADQWPKVHDQRIALVFQIEFEPLGWKYCGASQGPRMPSCKRQCRAFEQENPAELPLDVAGEPKAVLVAADKKCRDRLIDDAGIERLKRRDDGGGLVGRQDGGASAVWLDRCS